MFKLYIMSLLEQLKEISELYAILGDTYRNRAYLQAIISIRNKQTEGIGKSISEKIKEYNETGRISKLDELSSNPIIQGYKELQKIYGINIKTIKKYNLTSIEDLKEKIKSGSFKLTNNQKLGIKYYNDLNELISRKEMYSIYKKIKNLFPNIQMDIVGSYRRGKSSSKDVDILITTRTTTEQYKNKIKTKLPIEGILSDGENKFSFILNNNGKRRHIDIMFCSPEEYPTSLLAFTGSATFNRLLRLKAINLGLKLNEKGLYLGTKRVSGIKTEKDIFKKLNTSYLEPSER